MSGSLRFFAATLAVAAATAVTVVQGWPTLPRREPPREAVSRPAPAPALASARGLLERRLQLGLEYGQTARLEALDRQGQRESHALAAVVDAAEEGLSAFMKGAQGRRGTSLQELQRRSAEYRELSSELREWRRRHAAEALQVLNEAQRRLVKGDRR